jgi:hypothetical protein
MIETATRPTLVIYRRPGCHLCDDAELLLRDELAIRARSGLAPITVTRVDVSRDAGLQARYGRKIPVFAIGSVESDLVTTQRQVRDFLDRALPKPGA